MFGCVALSVCEPVYTLHYFYKNNFKSIKAQIWREISKKLRRLDIGALRKDLEKGEVRISENMEKKN